MWPCVIESCTVSCIISLVGFVLGDDEGLSKSTQLDTVNSVRILSKRVSLEVLKMTKTKGFFQFLYLTVDIVTVLEGFMNLAHNIKNTNNE